MIPHHKAVSLSFYTVIPSPSSSIVHPITIRTIPPVSSAFDLYFAPKRLPVLTPTAEKINVVTPIRITAGITATFWKEKVNHLPTAVPYLHGHKKQLKNLPV